MNMFAIKYKHSAPATRRSRPSRFGYVWPRVKAQQAEIRRILRSTGAQAKLTIGQPNDKYELEADRVADQVMLMLESGIQRQSLEDEEGLIQTKPNESLLQRQPSEEEEETIQAKEMPGQSLEVSNDVESTINNLRGGGPPLSNSVRDYM